MEKGSVTYFPEYKYTGITGVVYVPYTCDGRWYVIPNREVTFLEFLQLCQISDSEEATIIKLKA